MSLWFVFKEMELEYIKGFFEEIKSEVNGDTFWKESKDVD